MNPEHLLSEYGLWAVLIGSGLEGETVVLLGGLMVHRGLLSLLPCIGAAALDIAYVAAGRVDGFFERGLKPWDHAAADLLVTESGGEIAWIDDQERPLTVAAGPALIEQLVAVASRPV